MTCTLALLPLISNFLAQMLETQEHHCLRGTTSLVLSASSTASPPHLSFLFVVGSLSSTACSASLAKDLAPKSVRKIRKRRPLIRLLLLRCSKDAPYSGAICSLIFEEAVSIPTAPENVAGAPGFLLLTLFLCTYDSQVNSRPRKTMRWVSLVLDASPLSFPLRLKHTNKQTD